MAYEATGKLHEIMQEQQVSEKFRKREFVLEVVDGQYPEHIKFQLVQDKTSLVDPYKVGDEVRVQFNLRGRGISKNGETLYFTNLEAWRIEAAAGGGQAGPAGRKDAQPQRPAPITSDDDNDLPF